MMSISMTRSLVAVLLIPLATTNITTATILSPSPTIVDPSDGTHTVCAVRKLAYERALSKQPHNAPLQLLFDALELHTLCGIKQPEKRSNKNEINNTIANPNNAPINTNKPHLLVDSVAGDDNCDRGRPFRTVSAALAASRRHSPVLPLVLADGIHFLNETITLTSADNGFSITAAKGAKAWVSGGIPLTGLTWEKDSSTGVYSAAITDPTVVDIPGLMTVDTDTHSPTRLIRARYPNGNWETDMWGLCSTSACLDIGPAYTTPERWGGDPSISVNKAAAIPKSSVESWWQTPSKDLPKQIFFNATNGGAACNGATRNCTTYEYSMGSGGPCKLWAAPDSNQANEGSSYWCGAHCAGGGAGEDSAMSKMGWLGLPIGITFNKSSEVYARMQRWNHPNGAIVHAWMDSSWFTNMFEITASDVKAGNLSFEDDRAGFAGFPKGGWQGGRNWRTGGVAPGGGIGGDSTVAPLIVENIEEELDADNEYYFNPITRVLKIKPNASMVWPPAMLVATNLQTLVKLEGTQDVPVANITFSGIGWRDAAYTYMERWGVPSGGDWSLYHGAALHIHGATAVTVSNCNFVRLDNNAIILTGFTRNVSIVNNTASWLGMNFAAAWGDTNDFDATEGNQPRYTTLSGNLVGELGIWEKQSSFWFQAKSCLNKIKDNVVFNLPRAAINFNDMLGGGNVVSGNVIWNTCRESGDHGPMNSWDRLPFLTNLKYGVPSFEPLSNQISHNFISADYGGSQAFDNDDGSSWYHTFENFWYSSDGVKMDYSGHDSHFERNLVVVDAYDGQNCINGGGFPNGHRSNYTGNKCIIAGCRGTPRTNLHSACENKIGNFDCDANNLAPSMAKSWLLANNSYYSAGGNASLPCGVTIAAAAAAAAKDNGGPEMGSAAFALPTDDELIAFAKKTLKM